MHFPRIIVSTRSLYIITWCSIIKRTLLKSVYGVLLSLINAQCSSSPRGVLLSSRVALHDGQSRRYRRRDCIMSDDCGGCTTEFFHDRLLCCEGLRARRREGRIGRTTRELELNRRKWVCERSRGKKQRVKITANIETPPKRKFLWVL